MRRSFVPRVSRRCVTAWRSWTASVWGPIPPGSPRRPARPWWFHLDLDVLSTQALPAIDYPQPGGLGWDELAAVATVALSADPRGWDVTIHNPDLDPERVHARRIVRFIGSVIERVAKAP